MEKFTKIYDEYRCTPDCTYGIECGTCTYLQTLGLYRDSMKAVVESFKRFSLAVLHGKGKDFGEINKLVDKMNAKTYHVSRELRVDIRKEIIEFIDGLEVSEPLKIAARTIMMTSIYNELGVTPLMWLPDSIDSVKHFIQEEIKNDDSDIIKFLREKGTLKEDSDG